MLRQSERVVTSILDRRLDPPGTPTKRSSRVVWLASVVVVVFLLSLWWLAGGTFVGAPTGDSVGVAAQVGEDASFGFQVSADGSDARLQSVSARVAPAATVEWSVYQSIESTGFGTWRGPLAPTWPVEGLKGARVSEDDVRATWVVATVQSTTPGVYRVSDITIEYRSGWRSRSEESGFVGCVLVAPGDWSVDELRTSNDPLWQEYEACWASG